MIQTTHRTRLLVAYKLAIDIHWHLHKDGGCFLEVAIPSVLEGMAVWVL